MFFICITLPLQNQTKLDEPPEAVSQFLDEFKTKMKIWDVLFRDDRGKNTQTLIELELRPVERKAVLETLETKDYSAGPLPEKLYGDAQMWVFGKVVKKKEVYIKITMGATGTSVVCISFHLAEYKMTYPLK